MDQAKTSLPHIPSNPKSLAGQFTLPTHLTGIHAHGRLTLMVIDWGQFPHDSNLTINTLLLMLLRYKVLLSQIIFAYICLAFSTLRICLCNVGPSSPHSLSTTGQYLSREQEQIRVDILGVVGGDGNICQGT